MSTATQELCIYLGEPQVGKTINGLLVRKFVEVKRYPSGGTHHVWEVQCSTCMGIKQNHAQHVMNGTAKCSGICMKEKMGGKNHYKYCGGEYVTGYFISKARKNAEKRKSRVLEFSVSVEYLDSVWEAQKGKCVYTGRSLSCGTNTEECTASLDRIDSSKGYVEGNVQFVYKTVNWMKWTMSHEEFLATCEEIVKNATR